MQPRDDLLDASPLESERSVEERLRPRSLDEFIGQDRVRKNLGVFIKAARKRGEPLDHALFYGPPGLGKTALAHVIAREMDAPLRSTAGPVIEKAADLAAILTNLKPGEVLFIDEIHRLGAAIEEILYPAMEDFKLDLVLGHGPSASTLKLDLPRFTLIGATTRAGLLSSPLRDRFGVLAHLSYYPPDDLVRIVVRSAGILGVPIESDGAHEIARRSRGTPRVANRLLRRVRDYAEVEGDGTIEPAMARHALDELEVDGAGFDRMDREILLALIDKYGGGPVGVETLAAAVGEDKGTIEDIYEPFLIQEGFLERTPRGRVASERSFRHFGRTRDPAQGNGRQPKLF